MAEKQPGESTHQVEMPKTTGVKKTAQQNAAAQLLKRKILVDAQRKQARLDADNDEFVYFIKCPRVGWNETTGEGHVAAWLTEKPTTGRIHPGMWHSLQHEAGAPWTEPYIPCQECFVEGEERPWAPHLRGARRTDGSYDFVFSADRKHVLGRMRREQLSDRRTKIESAVGQETN